MEGTIQNAFYGCRVTKMLTSVLTRETDFACSAMQSGCSLRTGIQTVLRTKTLQKLLQSLDVRCIVERLSSHGRLEPDRESTLGCTPACILILWS